MKRNEIIKYILYFVIFTFLFFVEDRIGIRAFSVAFFMSLVYSKQNVLILAPIYVAAAMIVSFSLTLFIIAVCPCVVISVAYFVHYKFKKKIRLFAINIYVFISQIPLVVLEISTVHQIVATVIAILAAQVFVYCFVITIYAVLVKKLKYKLTSDEIMAFCVTLALLGMGLYATQITWFNLYFAVLPIILLLLLFIDKKGVIFASISMGIGASLMSGNPYPLALSALYGMIYSCFTTKTQYFALIAVLAMDIIFRSLFAVELTFGYFNIISPAIGVFLALLIPNKAKNLLAVFSVCFKERQGSRSMINRERQLIAGKLNTLSNVFYEIQDILYIENREKKESLDIQFLTKELSARCCQSCASLNSCKQALGGGETDMVLGGLVMAAIDNGKATILDTPPFLSSRCRKINGLISTVNDLAERYKKGEQSKDNLNEGRVMISQQMGGVGNILDELKNEFSKALNYDTFLEDRLIENLNANNIAASEAVVYFNRNKESSLTLVVKESDCGKSLLLDIVNTTFGYPMEVVDKEKLVKGMVNLHLEKAPQYKVSYGERFVSKEENSPSGDRCSAIKITNSKVMLILSDGMGSGKDAGINSGYAISLIESFYKAGFDHATIVNTASRLLSLRSREEFNAIDIAVIDTTNGWVDFIKMGGRESFIVNKGAVEVIECGSLPIGILDEDIKPIIEKRKLAAGSFIVMISDGVIDTLGREPLVELLSEMHTTNPDSAAALITADLQRILKDNPTHKDDALVLVAKIFNFL